MRQCPLCASLSVYWTLDRELEMACAECLAVWLVLTEIVPRRQAR